MALPKVDYFQLPLETGKFRWTTPFGFRDYLHPNGHRGTDLAAPAGTPIRASAAGVVRRVEHSGCLGWYIVTEHAIPGSKATIFLGSNHMRERALVKVGAKVARGQVIGYVGSTGSCTTGPHDHFTAGPTVDSNVWGTVVDARAFVEAHDAPDRAPARTPLTRKVVTLQSGSTLSQLAAANRISLATLLRLNPAIKDPDHVAAGLKVRVH